MKTSVVSRDKLRLGDVVLMGRPNGQKSRCKVKRINQKTCTVTLLERYGSGRGSEVGHEWRVPFTLLWPAAETAEEAAEKAAETKKNDDLLLAKALMRHFYIGTKDGVGFQYAELDEVAEVIRLNRPS